MRIDGFSRLIAHVGYPTTTFKAPLIYNPYFASAGINALVMPMGVQAEDFPAALAMLRRVTNFHGALITMPHKIAVVAHLDAISTTARIAGACNAVVRREDGALVGDMFDGEGFVRGLMRKGLKVRGGSALVVGSGGVGSAIAASLAAAGIARLALHDLNPATMEALAARLRTHYPAIEVSLGSNDPQGFDLVVNGTPLGMKEGDAMPVDVARLAPETFVGEVVLKQEMTAFLTAAQARGCRVQVGLDMLFEMIPAYLEFFGFPTTTPENLRALAQV